MKVGGEDKKRSEMPAYLKRSLSFKETSNRRTAAEDRDSFYVVWKHGRSSHFTYGKASEIKTDYLSTSGHISDEWTVLDGRQGIDTWSFSQPGDSGSLVWDSKGFVSGLLWGDDVNGHANYVTPMETVIKDIKKVCQTDNVELVVRPEDESDEVFGTPERTRGMQTQYAESEYSGLDLSPGALAEAGF